MSIRKAALFIRDLLAGNINYKMLKYHVLNRSWRSPASQHNDDFNWSKYSLHYEGELKLGRKTRTLCLEPGDYIFSNGKLTKKRDILPLHPNVHVLYETILQLSPNTVLEIGCGGGDNLHNLKTLRADLDIFGRDISDGQLNLLRTLHSELSPHVSQLDITQPLSPTNQVDLVFTQAVIMHIGEQQRRHISALNNLFKLASKQVVLMENWSKHCFFDDIRNLIETDSIEWENCYLYYRLNTHDPSVRLLIASSTPLGYLPLTTYDSLLTPEPAKIS